MTVIIIVVFIVGLIMFLSKLPALIKAAKEGWQSGWNAPTKGDKKDKTN